MRYFILSLFTYALFAAEDIGGFWKKLDDDGKPQCIFGIYEHEGTYYGRIIGSYDENGQLSDTIYKPVGKAGGIVGTPHTCGLDIIYGLYDNGDNFVGKIVDPTKGNIYNCEVWLQGDYLIVRGKVMMFGRSMTWYPISKADLPKNFKLPNMKTFVPSVPQVN